jgi:HAE1 family hydrophobic/amphiphilic exporter-1
MIKGLVNFSLNRRVTVVMLAVTLMLFGFIALKDMRFTLLPDLEYPTVTVRSELTGAGPEEVETLLTRPLEENLGVVKGLKRIYSTSTTGQADVRLEFGWDSDMKQVAYDVRDRLGVLQLPLEASQPILLRFNPSSDPILRLALTSDKKDSDLKSLRHFAEQVLKKKLEPIAGVAAVQVSGGLEEEIQVLVDQYKLARLGLSVSEISQRLKQENINLSGGAIRQGTQQFLVRTVNQFKNLDDIQNLIITLRDGVPIRLRDVADIQRSHKDRTSINRLNGQEAIEVAIYKEGDANTVQVADAVKKALPGLRQQLPAGTQLRVIEDQSLFIAQAIDNVVSAAVLGGLLAVLVIYLFLRDMRSTAIIATLIPVSVVAGFFFMYQADISLNIMSLGGIALAIGLLVDNGIVVLENIASRRRAGAQGSEAVRVGTHQVAGAIFASTLTTVAVFFPLVFVQGIAGQLFRDQALTVTFTLLISLLIALTLIPMLSSLGTGRQKKTVSGASDREVPSAATDTSARAVNKPPSGTAANLTDAPEHMPKTRIGRAIKRLRQGLVNGVFNGLVLFLGSLWAVLIGTLKAILHYPSLAVQWLLQRVTALYARVLPWALRHRWQVVGLAVLVLAASLLLLPRLGMNLIPDLDENRLQVKFRLAEGQTIEATDKVLQSISTKLKDRADIEFVFGTAGQGNRLDAGTDLAGENAGEVVFRLKPGVDKQAFAREVLRVFQAHPGVNVELAAGKFFELAKPVEIELFGHDLKRLRQAAEKVARRLTEVPGLVNVDSGVRRGQPEVRIRFDQEKLAALGLKVRQVADVVVNRILGKNETRVHWQDQKIDLLVRSRDEQRQSINDLSQLIINPGAETPITLGSVAQLEQGEGPGRILRRDQNRVMVVSADLDNSRDLAEVSKDIRQAMQSTPLHPGVHWQLAGQNREMQQSYRSLLFALGLAVFLVYMVLASQFESFVHPFVILLTIPLALIGVIWALYLTNTPLSVIVFIGLIMLAGIVVNNAIVLIDLIKQLQARGLSAHEAIVQAGSQRLRPILMTTVTTVLGLLPMALVTQASQSGAEIRQPMAITVIGGLLVATVLTLVVIPVVYSLLSHSRKNPQVAENTGESPLAMEATHGLDS